MKNIIILSLIISTQILLADSLGISRFIFSEPGTTNILKHQSETIVLKYSKIKTKRIDGFEYLCQTIEDDNISICINDTNNSVIVVTGKRKMIKFSLKFIKNKNYIYFNNPFDANNKCTVHFTKSLMNGNQIDAMIIKCYTNSIEFRRGLGIYKIVFGEKEKFTLIDRKHQ